MPENEMSAEQALATIDGVCASFQGTRKDHAALQHAIQILARLVQQDRESQESEKEGED